MSNQNKTNNGAMENAKLRYMLYLKDNHHAKRAVICLLETTLRPKAVLVCVTKCQSTQLNAAFESNTAFSDCLIVSCKINV